MKATVTLRLIGALEGRAFGSWAFEDERAMVGAMSEIVRGNPRLMQDPIQGVFLPQPPPCANG